MSCLLMTMLQIRVIGPKITCIMLILNYPKIMPTQRARSTHHFNINLQTKTIIHIRQTTTQNPIRASPHKEDQTPHSATHKFTTTHCFCITSCVQTSKVSSSKRTNESPHLLRNDHPKNQMEGTSLNNRSVFRRT